MGRYRSTREATGGGFPRAAALRLACFVVVATIALPLATRAGTPFSATFDGEPTAPQPYQNPDGWDIVPTGFDAHENGTWAQRAQHGPNCDNPGFPYTAGNSHPLTSAADTVFLCHGHVMTAPGLSGYGAVYMVPPAMADFSAGTATIRFDMSTLRTSARDWVYFTLMPFAGHNKFSYNNNDQAIAPNNLNIKLQGTDAFTATERVNGSGDVSLVGNSYTTWDMVQSANGVSPDAARRDTFEISVSRTHLRMCLVGNNLGQAYAYNGGRFCWVDADLPTPLAPSIWRDQAVFMMTHVAYNPEKACSSVDDQFSIVHNATGDADCPPNTWHWDNVNISPATPFSIVPAQPRMVEFTDPSARNTVTFASPAPANAFLSYIAAGDCTKQTFSVDGGTTWIKAVPQPATTQCQHGENGGEYFTPIPVGTTSVTITGEPMWGKWSAGGIAIWASGQPGPSPTPTPVGTASPTPTSTAVTPSPTGPATSATASATSTSAGTTTVTFDEPRNVNAPLTGPQPSGVIDWGSSGWWVSAPWGGFTTNSVSLASGPTSATFTILGSRTLDGMNVFNGGSSTSTLTLACAGNPTVTRTIGPGVVMAVTTGWTSRCETVTLSSSNGWDTNFDDLRLSSR